MSIIAKVIADFVFSVAAILNFNLVYQKKDVYVMVLFDSLTMKM